MSQTQVALPLHNQSEIIRLVSDFPEDIWGDSFSSYTLDKQMYDMYAKEIEIMKEDGWHPYLKKKKSMLTATHCSITEKLKLIDKLERLGISYHFEEEIEHQLEEIFKLSTNYEEEYLHSYDLFTAALHFRLLRQHHFNISCGIFDKFVDANSKFKETLCSDINGLLSLYEAAQVRTRKDSILEEALTFTLVHLKREPLQASSTLAKQVKFLDSLYNAVHKGSLRVEARRYISAYEEEECHNELLLRFAKLDYNMLQMLHKEELFEIIRDQAASVCVCKIPNSRVRLVESYFCALGMFFEPQHSFGRINLAKTTVLSTIFDGTYDAYGTLDELKVLTGAIDRWDASEMDRLSDNMRTCRVALLNVTDGLDKELSKQGRLYASEQYKEEWKIYTKGMYNESRWFIKRDLSAYPEYFSNGMVTSLAFLIFIIGKALVNVQKKTGSRDVFDWLSSRPKILVACSTICRLTNDVASYKLETQRGGTGNECYMKHYNVSEQEAVDKFEEMIVEAWKDINEEWLRPTTVSREVLMPILSLARMEDVLYKYHEDGFTDPHKVIKDYIIELLMDPLTV
ncbi:unnamed protein product [Coffea canephora]|uniref:Uncharacterized protein n=1 Tax=Coffea canephora TaxID=49390 RepID=A0A068URD6_COFCA|nr:unnamed protein product [Coffea canephora]